jgi:hypothetical protein
MTKNTSTPIFLKEGVQNFNSHKDEINKAAAAEKPNAKMNSSAIHI